MYFIVKKRKESIQKEWQKAGRTYKSYHYRMLPLSFKGMAHANADRNPIRAVKGQCHEIFNLSFFSEITPKPLIIQLGVFGIFPIRGDIQKWKKSSIRKVLNILLWAPLGSGVIIQVNFFLQVHVKV
jgi:hypothetical protein